jgi:hypothetical protein
MRTDTCEAPRADNQKPVCRKAWQRVLLLQLLPLRCTVPLLSLLHSLTMQVEMAGVYAAQERAAAFLDQLSNRSLPILSLLSGQARLFAALDVLVQAPDVAALRDAFQSLNTGVVGRFNSFHAVLKRYVHHTPLCLTPTQLTAWALGHFPGQQVTRDR